MILLALEYNCKSNVRHHGTGSDSQTSRLPSLLKHCCIGEECGIERYLGFPVGCRFGVRVFPGLVKFVNLIDEWGR